MHIHLTHLVGLCHWTIINVHKTAQHQSYFLHVLKLNKHDSWEHIKYIRGRSVHGQVRRWKTRRACINFNVIHSTALKNDQVRGHVTQLLPANVTVLLPWWRRWLQRRGRAESGSYSVDQSDRLCAEACNQPRTSVYEGLTVSTASAGFRALETANESMTLRKQPVKWYRKAKTRREKLLNMAHAYELNVVKTLKTHKSRPQSCKFVHNKTILSLVLELLYRNFQLRTHVQFFARH